MKRVLAVAAIVVPAIASTVQASGAQPAGVSDFDWALSAAPPSIAAGAAVVNMSDDGKVTELRKGTNAWTCVVHDPGTPSGHPLCLDRNGLEWMQAAMSGREPDLAKTGCSYMLKGGTAWSNTDVMATKPASGQQDYVHVPPHIMIMMQLPPGARTIATGRQRRCHGHGTFGADGFRVQSRPRTTGCRTLRSSRGPARSCPSRLPG